jgi:uncharacterized membrane protein YraQ (UPF0718 family)
MLQRIQTIFLGIIPLTLVMMQFLPIWSQVDPGTLHNLTLYAWKLQALYPADGLVNTWTTPYVVLGILAITISILAIYEIWRYDNRTLQLQIGAINSLLLTALVGAIVYFCTKNQSALWPLIKGHYQVGFYMPIMAVICNLLANYFIRKDERLVQSAHRIR